VEGAFQIEHRFLFTSESVTEGHPDKIADQVLRRHLDACLEQDPYSRVAAETLTATGLVVIAGEITPSLRGLPVAVRGVVASIGYDKRALRLRTDQHLRRISSINSSRRHAQGVDTAAPATRA